MQVHVDGVLLVISQHLQMLLHLFGHFLKGTNGLNQLGLGLLPLRLCQSRLLILQGDELGSSWQGLGVHLAKESFGPSGEGCLLNLGLIESQSLGGSQAQLGAATTFMGMFQFFPTVLETSMFVLDLEELTFLESLLKLLIAQIKLPLEEKSGKCLVLLAGLVDLKGLLVDEVQGKGSYGKSIGWFWI